MAVKPTLPVLIVKDSKTSRPDELKPREDRFYIAKS